MDQYYLLRRKVFSSLQNAFLYAAPTQLFVRFMGSHGGGAITKIDCTGKQLSIKRGKNQIIFSVNGKQCYSYKKRWNTPDNTLTWVVEYSRFTADGRMLVATTGFPNPVDPYEGPDDPRLPAPEKTTLRSCNGEHLVEITFPGKIPVTPTNERTKNAAFLHEWLILKKENTMNHSKNTTELFKDISKSRIFSIVHSTNIANEQRKEKLEEYAAEIKNTAAYQKGEDAEFMEAANNALKNIDEELKKLQ